MGVGDVTKEENEKKKSTNCSRTVLKNKYELECVQIQAKKQCFYKIITRS